MATTIPTGTTIAEGDIVIGNIPFEEDRYLDKARTAFVIGFDGGAVIVRGIYSKHRAGRRPISVTPTNGLHHHSFLGARPVRVPRQRIHRLIGETHPDFDPFDDFAN